MSEGKFLFGPMQTIVSGAVAEHVPIHVASVQPKQDISVPLYNDTVLLAFAARKGELIRIPTPFDPQKIIMIWSPANDTVQHKEQAFQVFDFGIISAKADKVLREFQDGKLVSGIFITYALGNTATYSIKTDIMVALGLEFELVSGYTVLLPILRFTDEMTDQLKTLLKTSDKTGLQNKRDAILSTLDQQTKVKSSALNASEEEKAALFNAVKYIMSQDPITRLKIISKVYRKPMSQAAKKIWRGGVPDSAVVLETVVTRTATTESESVTELVEL